MVKPARTGSLTVTRGDVWLLALDPTVGSEIRNTRPHRLAARDPRLFKNRDSRADDDRQPPGTFSHSGQLWGKERSDFTRSDAHLGQATSRQTLGSN